jgi:hypothetical protein
MPRQGGGLGAERGILQAFRPKKFVFAKPEMLP